MTRRRWIADRVTPDGASAFLAGENAFHLARVLRARPGQQFDVALPTGEVRTGTIVAADASQVEFSLGAEVEQHAAAAVALLLAIFKFDRFEWAVEKATELGVSEIIPVIARRSEPHLVKAAEKRVERWTRIAHEASQQSRRSAAPRIAPPQRLTEAIARPAALRIVLSEGERGQSMLQALEGAPAGEIALAVGPEGGWTSEEISVFAAAGWQSASLGPTVLRAETAAIAALALAVAVAGEEG